MSSSTQTRATAVREGVARASGTEPGDWHLVSKGRHAMLLVLAQLEPGEVVTQPLTCLTAVAPAISAGHTPVYADVDRATLAIDPATAAPLVGARTRALVGQHTFGAAAPLEQLRTLLPDDVLLMEDSAHCLGDITRDGEGEPVADVSVHSFGLEKMLPTRTGAAVWVNPASAGRPWHDRLLAALGVLADGGVRGTITDVASPVAQKVARRLGAPGARALDLAARTGLVEKVIQTSELAGTVSGEPTALTGPALAAVARELPALAASQRHRRRTAAIYREGLEQVPGVELATTLDVPGRAMVRYPVLLGSTERAEAVFAALAAEGLVPGRWYRPLLFPGPSDPAAYAYAPGTSPVAEDVSARILNLPTAPFVTEAAARRAVEVVRTS